ncbi:hypothetical protein FQN57_007071 [Myotisia sp. PD_48]|nr:hypothetical protein FQN57_007071 [Myotisia sp. PD_48]
MASTYNLVEYDAEEERENDPRGPPRPNILAAAAFIHSLLAMNGVVHAMVGGFAMNCRGSQRNTWDIDVVADATMARIWAILIPQPRLKIPNTRLIEGVLKLFVETGPNYESSSCQESRWIDVDIMTPGFGGSPRDLTSHVVEIPVKIGDHQIPIPCLDILYMVRLKLAKCVTRDVNRDIHDLQYLLDTYPTDISNICKNLDQNEVDELFELDWVRDSPYEVVTRWQQILGR